MEPNAVVEIDQESEARALVRLMESLDDHDDVEAVHANFDIPESAARAGRGLGHPSRFASPRRRAPVHSRDG